MPKQTILEENAVIYQPRKELTEREKLSDMRFRDKLHYLWDYYKMHALIGIAVIALSSSLIYNIVTPNIKTQFYLAMINNIINEEVLETYKTEFAQYLELDPKTEKVDFNHSFYFNNADEYSMSLKEVLNTYMVTQEIDVIIAPESEFSSYAYYGYMDKLSDQLPTDLYSSLTDSFFLSDLEGDSEKNVYGIYLTDTELYKNISDAKDPIMLGIAVNSKRKEKAIEFIRFLFKE